MASDKLNDYLTTFKKECDDVAAGSADAWRKMLESAKAKYDEMKKQAGSGSKEVWDQLKQVQADLMAKMKKSNADNKEKLKGEWEAWSKKNSEEIESGWAEMKKSMINALNKTSDQSSKTYKDAVNKIENWNPKGKSQSEMDKFYNDSVKSIDNNFNEAVDKVKLN